MRLQEKIINEEVGQSYKLKVSKKTIQNKDEEIKGKFRYDYLKIVTGELEFESFGNYVQ